MIRPPEVASVESPLKRLCAMFQTMSDMRTQVLDMLPHDESYQQLVNEIHMILSFEKKPMGLRSPWVKNYVVPLLWAQRELDTDSGTPQERAKKALDALGMCSSKSAYTLCSEWIKREYHVQ